MQPGKYLLVIRSRMRRHYADCADVAEAGGADCIVESRVTAVRANWTSTAPQC